MFKKILLPIDLAHPSSWERLLPVAINQAKLNGAKLHVINVIPDYGMPIVGSFFPGNYTEEILKSTTKDLKDFVKKNIPAELVAESHVMFGKIYMEILATAKEQKCDLIVMSSQRSENADFLLGTNAARVVRHAKESVFVVR